MNKQRLQAALARLSAARQELEAAESELIAMHEEVKADMLAAESARRGIPLAIGDRLLETPEFLAECEQQRLVMRFWRVAPLYLAAFDDAGCLVSSSGSVSLFPLDMVFAMRQAWLDLEQST